MIGGAIEDAGGWFLGLGQDIAEHYENVAQDIADHYENVSLTDALEDAGDWVVTQVDGFGNAV